MSPKERLYAPWHHKCLTHQKRTLLLTNKDSQELSEFTYQIAAYLWETPIGGRMEAEWGQCTRSCFHGYPQ